MTVLNTGISWTHSTWNPSTGCTKVSEGCRFCYAEALTNRLWGGGFENVRMHPKRLDAVRSFTPFTTARGVLTPRLVFVNSMSDLMHEAITDEFRDQCFDAMDTMRNTVFQILTKRPMSLRRYAERRWTATGVPDNIWLGVSVEDNRVAGRIGQLARMKDAIGPFTAFLSVEPLIGPTDRHSYVGVDQVLIGGESGNGARPMDITWARTSRDLARAVGAAVWFKQFGQWANNPLYQTANANTHLGRVQSAIARGEREARIIYEKDNRPKITGEKGGATLDNEVLHELPPAYERIRLRLNPSSALI